MLHGKNVAVQFEYNFDTLISKINRMWIRKLEVILTQIEGNLEMEFSNVLIYFGLKSKAYLIISKNHIYLKKMILIMCQTRLA